MYGSASTWTFNVVQLLAAAMTPERPVLGRFVSDSLEGLDAPDSFVVVKTHAAPAARALAERARTIIVTIRDPRDAIASLMAHNKAPFPLALQATQASAQMCAAYASDPRAVLLRFEDRFFEREATIDRLAATLPGTLSPQDRARIIAQTRREAIDSFIAGLDTMPGVRSGFDTMTGQNDVFDPATGWHRHHAGRKGETGRWQQELSANQVARIEALLLGVMRRFGYEAAKIANLRPAG
jgi:hypothetical protein